MLCIDSEAQRAELFGPSWTAHGCTGLVACSQRPARSIVRLAMRYRCFASTPRLNAQSCLDHARRRMGVRGWLHARGGWQDLLCALQCAADALHRPRGSTRRVVDQNGRCMGVWRRAWRTLRAIAMISSRTSLMIAGRGSTWELCSARMRDEAPGESERYRREMRLRRMRAKHSCEPCALSP